MYEIVGIPTLDLERDLEYDDVLAMSLLTAFLFHRIETFEADDDGKDSDDDDSDDDDGNDDGDDSPVGKHENSRLPSRYYRMPVNILPRACFSYLPYIYIYIYIHALADVIQHPFS